MMNQHNRDSVHTRCHDTLNCCTIQYYALLEHMHMQGPAGLSRSCRSRNNSSSIKWSSSQLTVQGRFNPTIGLPVRINPSAYCRS